MRAAGGVTPMRVHLARGGSSPRRRRDRMMQGDGEQEGQICASYLGGGHDDPVDVIMNLYLMAALMTQH